MLGYHQGSPQVRLVWLPGLVEMGVVCARFAKQWWFCHRVSAKVPGDGSFISLGFLGEPLLVRIYYANLKNLRVAGKFSTVATTQPRMMQRARDLGPACHLGVSFDFAHDPEPPCDLGLSYDLDLALFWDLELICNLQAPRLDTRV